MSRFGRILILCVICVCLLATAVFAESNATEVIHQCVVSADGRCQVSLTAKVRLDSAATNFTFPLPAAARNVTMNGSSVRTIPSGSDPNVVLADLSDLDGFMGDYVMNFSYTLPDVLYTDETGKEPKLMMEIPMLCGFIYPVQKLSYSITMPGHVSGRPTFTSGYLQTSIESIMTSEMSGQMITGSSTQPLQDRETVTLRMQVSELMFPGKLVIARDGNPEIVPMSICAVLALIYWIIFMRTGPVVGQRRTTPIEGVTAGELGSRLTAAGADLTMMVFTWAQLGYLRIRLDKYGRVFLEKRMDMGNERTDFENRCFHALFKKGDRVEATGIPYARLCRTVSETISGVREMYIKRAGNVNIFRALCCGISIFCGICFGMNLQIATLVQKLLCAVFAIVGAATAWAIQGGMYKIHVRGKVSILVGMVSIILWLVIGIIPGQWLMAIIVVLAQVLAGLAAAYGGRRSELGKYNASQILGLRHYLGSMSQEELQRMVSMNPDYFFDMLPYAIALGVDTRFAKAFGKMRLPDCSYLLIRQNEKRSASEWALLVRKIADRMDERQRRMELETWIPVAPPPKRR